MKILFEIGHPGHVHHFKHIILNLENRGHGVKICAADKDVTVYLLECYRFRYELLGKSDGGRIVGKIPLYFGALYTMIKVVKRFRPDLYVSRGSPVSAHASKIFRKPHIAFIDSEYRGLSGIMSFGLNDVICTPTCFTRDLGKKQVRFNGYFELAYLHPNYFTPNSAVLDQLGLVRRDRFIVLRFVSWRASHDVGRSGIRNKIELVKELEKHGKVLISSESKLEKELEKYRIKIGPEYIHDLLYYAHMFFGDSQTMTTEAAILGTPAIRCNSFVGDKDMGNFLELEKKYGLIFNFRDIKDAVRKAGEILKKGNVKNEWESKKIALYNDKMDVVEFTVRLLEKYVKANGK